MTHITADQAIHWQAEHCLRNDAPVTARVLLALAGLLGADLEIGGLAVGARMRDWPGLALADAMPLRLAAGFHHLALSGADARMAPVYAGTVTAQAEVDALVLAVARDHDAALLPWLDGPPQTNEAGRSASIVAGLLWLAARGVASRFAMNEIGASAGANTMIDRYAYDLGGVRVGGPSSVTIRPVWRGGPPPAARVEIVAIEGCDQAPIVLADPAAALRLKAYVWPENTARLARLDGVTALARAAPPRVARADAADWVEARLALPQEAGVCRVLYHSIVWQYISPAGRARIEAAMEAAGSRATAERPLAWIMLETDRATFRHELRVRHWPDGGDWHLLGAAHAHGAWVEWF